VNTGATRVACDYCHDAKFALARLKPAGVSRIGLVLDTSTHERTDRRHFREQGGTAPRFHPADATRSETERARHEKWPAAAKPEALLTDFSRS
jgi:glutaredoxin